SRIMKHIVYINYEYPPLGGGGGRAMSQIASRMVNHDTRVSIITSAFNSLPSKENLNGCDIYRIPTLRRCQEKCSIFEMVLFMISSLIFVPWIMRKQKMDVVVAFFTIPSGPSAWLLSRIKKCPLIISLRGGDVPGFMGSQLSIYHHLMKPLIRFLWRQSAFVVANSNGLKNLARQTDPGIDYKVIPNGIDLRLIKSVYDLRQRRTGNDEPFIVLTAGRLSPQKSIETLIEGFDEFIKTTKLNALLWIVGDGPEMAKLDSLIKKLNLSDKVVFWGWKRQEELIDFYSKAHVFVLTSVNEGMPNVVLEAMKEGLPILATSVEGIEELVDEGLNGFVIAIKDSRALCQKLKILAGDETLRYKMACQSIHKVLAFDWQQITTSYEELCWPK
ncbi:MAG: hypothetical protein ACD_73C00554G0001, partial [uncultured bacterium]